MEGGFSLRFKGLRERPAKDDLTILARMTALAMRAARPTAWPSHSFSHLINANFDPSLSGFGLLCGTKPANPFVAGQWSKCSPKGIRQTIGYDCLLKVIWKLVH